MKIKDDDSEDELLIENEEIKEEIREEYDDLHDSINNLTYEIRHTFSYWQTLWRGIVQGVGVAVGSGIVFVILSAVLYQLFTYLGLGAEIKELLPVKYLPGESMMVEAKKKLE